MKMADKSSLSSAATADYSANLSTRKVHLLTTFQLRQELVKRNCLDIPEGQIHHKSMLERLMRELIKDEQVLADAKSEAAAATEAAKRDEMKRLREEKKREALERSRLRTENTAYFDEKKKSNDIKVVGSSASTGDSSNSSSGSGGSEEGTDNSLVDGRNGKEEEEEDEEDDDPFRSQTKKNRNKIFVR